MAQVRGSEPAHFSELFCFRFKRLLKRAPKYWGPFAVSFYDTQFTRLDWRNDTPTAGADNGT